MTRETKVGLLVGMGVILLIGIIVSDQLSSIQRQDAADLTQFAGEAQESIAPLGAATPAPAEPRFDTTTDARAHVLTPPGSTLRTDAPVVAEEITVPPEYAAPPINPQREARADSVLEHIALRTDAARPAPQVDPAMVERTVTETVIPLQPAVPTIALDTPAAPPQPAATTITPAVHFTGSPAATASKGKTHTVAEGESLYRIAERYLGDGTAWKKIADANPGKVTSDGQVLAGVELTIPGAPAAGNTGATAGGATALRPVQPTTATPAPKPARTYTVKPGDSLYRIAQQQMGDGTAWKKIADANPGKVTRDGQVLAGVVLTIPG